jgi:hypothetical protein
MRSTALAVAVVGMVIVCPLGHANTVAEFDLDARNDFNLQELSLNAGQYSISLRNGAFTAWSNFDTTSSNCTSDCLQGWLNFFSFFNVQTGEGVYVENGVGTPHVAYDFNYRLAYSTPEAALAAAHPFHFLLDSSATVQVSIPDCPGCFIDNRGGLSFSIELVPEPSALVLVAVALSGIGLLQRQQRKAAADSQVLSDKARHAAGIHPVVA